MSYTIIKTDGSSLTSVVDGTIDQVTTDLTLIGKNTSGYGIFVNDNFVHLLENFANTSEPNNPIKGQLWYDTTENRLKVYNGAQFVVSGGTIVGGNVPSSITAGDLWIDNIRRQLYFNDGLVTTLAGPLYTAEQGLSGFQVEDILDINDVQHTIVYLFVAQTLLGIFSKDAFTPKLPIAGMSGQLGVGFTASNLSSLTFNVPVEQSNSLIASDGTLKFASDFISTSDDSQSLGTLSIQNGTPLILGASANTEINVTPATFQIKANSINQNFQFSVLNSSGVMPGIFVDAANMAVGIFASDPSETLDVAGNARIRGNLTVEGTTTSITSTTVSVADKNIELANSDTPSDVLADGGGITLKGSSNKTFNWINSTDSWTSSENIDLAVGKTFKINGFDVISGASLGLGITSAPGLTSVGTLSTLQVTNIGISGNTIGYVNPVGTNGNVVIQPKGSGSVDVDNSTIINVASPANPTDAANRTFVETSIRSKPVAISVNPGTRTPAQIAADFLSKIFPSAEHEENTICRVYQTTDSNILQYALQSGVWVFITTL